MRRHANIIGQNIAKYRYQRHWTQDDLVAKLHRIGLLDITRNSVANFETRRSSPSDIQTSALAEALGVAVADLFRSTVSIRDFLAQQMQCPPKKITPRRRRRSLKTCKS